MVEKQMVEKKGKKRSALGRGLDALILPSDDVRGGGTLILCGIEEVYPNKEQPRKYFDEEKLSDLVASIREKGVIQPIIVRRRSSSSGGYQIITGERRWRASQKAGLTEIPVIVKDVSDTEALELALIENIQREDLNPIEQAQGYKKLIEDFMYTQEELAVRLGKSRTTITNLLRLLKLPEKAKELVIAREISEGHARALLGVFNTSDIDTLLSKIIKRGMSVRDTERLVRKINAPVKKKTETAEQKQLKQIENELIDHYKTKISVSKKGKKGKIVLEFYSNDDLMRLLELLTK